MDRIELGRVGEYGARKIDFDLSEFNGLSGTYLLLHQRSSDFAPYVVANISVAYPVLTWTVDATDTACEGIGTAEIRLVRGDALLAKSKQYMTNVEGALGVPEPAKAYSQATIDTVAEYAASASQSETDASAHANSANAAKSDAVDAKNAAAESASSASASAASASGSAIAAAGSATDAEAYKNAALSAKTDAENSASSASGSATAAAASAAAAQGGKPLLITKSTSASTAFDMISTAFNNDRLVYYDYRISGTNHRVLLPLMAKNTNSSAPSVTFWFEGFDPSDKKRYRIMIYRSGRAGSYSYNWGSIDSIAFPDPPGSPAGYYTLKARVYYNGSKYVTSVYWDAD